MKLKFYICKFHQWHLKGINCECGRRPIHLSSRKTH